MKISQIAGKSRKVVFTKSFFCISNIINKIMTEVIKDIKGFEDRYTISNLGIVRSKLTHIKMKPSVTKFGYLRVNLRKEHSREYKSYFIHRLVACHFLPNPNNLPEVNHIDCNRQNNIVTNLEWVSRQDNIKHSFKYGLASNKGLRNPRAKLNLEDIEAIKAMKKTNRWYNTQIAKFFNVSPSSIDFIIQGKTWSDNKTNRDNQQPSKTNSFEGSTTKGETTRRVDDIV